MPIMKEAPVKKLVVTDETLEHNGSFYFRDPETGRLYRPRPTFTVTGDDLIDLFEPEGADSA